MLTHAWQLQISTNGIYNFVWHSMMRNIARLPIYVPSAEQIWNTSPSFGRLINNQQLKLLRIWPAIYSILHTDIPASAQRMIATFFMS